MNNFVEIAEIVKKLINSKPDVMLNLWASMDKASLVEGPYWFDPILVPLEQLNAIALSELNSKSPILEFDTSILGYPGFEMAYQFPGIATRKFVVEREAEEADIFLRTRQEDESERIAIKVLDAWIAVCLIEQESDPVIQARRELLERLKVDEAKNTITFDSDVFSNVGEDTLKLFKLILETFPKLVPCNPNDIRSDRLDIPLKMQKFVQSAQQGYTIDLRGNQPKKKQSKK